MKRADKRADFRRLAELRLREAKVLLDRRYYAGAYYLAGYAVECALKACVAKLTMRYDFPDKNLAQRSHTHDLEKLVDVALLKTHFDIERHSNKYFDSNWNIAKRWSEEARYAVGISASSATELYAAITDPTNGVMQWLRKYW